MDIWKTAGGAGGAGIPPQDMDAINRLAKKVLRPEEVYTFAVRLCDNRIDRDYERFDRQALMTLGDMFTGKSGIFDHNWSAKGQAARLYRTEVVEEWGDPVEGERPCYLKGYAYMLRTEKNRALIEEIEGGIKREVSIGCSVKKRVCSICGGSDCGHIPGKSYEGQVCHMTLKEPADAYEWSFVAVPAQREAGVIKSYGSDLRSALSGESGCLAALDALEADAALGRSYMKSLRQEVVRLAGLAEGELDIGVFAGAAEKMEESELLELRRVWEKRLGGGEPVMSQLRTPAKADLPAPDGSFLI